MPANRTPRRRRPRLTIDQRFSLTVGADVYPKAFGSDAERRQAWAQWREHMLSTCRYGKRPAAWWNYEAPFAPPADRHLKPAMLFASKLLPPREAKQLHDYWRARYEQAYENGEGFVHCLGPDEWLHGDAARRAHFRMYGILPALVEQWEQERNMEVS
jgi:hypothetical protein